jgi:hypothetical protein
MGLWDFRKEEEARISKYQALVAGCPKHPAYRYQLAPRTKCACCHELFDYNTQLKEWDEAVKGWWKTYHAVERKRQDAESRRMEDYLNSPG